MSYALISLYKNISQENNHGTAAICPAGQTPPAESTYPTSILSLDSVSNNRDNSLASSHIGKGEITVMVVNPVTFYCYWELNQAVSERYILTIYNISKNTSWEIPIDNLMGSMYIKIDETSLAGRPSSAERPSPARPVCHTDGSSYFQIAVRIDFQTNEMTPTEAECSEKKIFLIALSNIVAVPPSVASNCLDQKWWSPQEEAPPLAGEQYGVVTVSSEMVSHFLLGLVGAVREPLLQPSLLCISRK